MFRQILNRKRLFLISFFIVILLILLLGETFLKWYLYGVVGLFFIFFFKNHDYSKLIYYKKLILLWLCFIGLILASFFWTASISLSLDYLFYYLTGFLISILFVSLPEKFLDKKELSFGLIVLGVVLSILSYFFFFNKSLGNSLPGMNLLYSTYGHNHLSALLLLITPISWWWFFSRKKNNRGWPSILIAFFTLTLVLSFGRIATAIGLIQLVFIGFISKGKEKNKSLLFLAIILLVSLLFKIILSSNISLVDNSLCRIDFISSNLCKSIKDESRLHYWNQAIVAIKNNKIVGYGAGTFELLSTKYAIFPWASSKYAHNYFLKIFTEVGLIGGILFLASIFWSLVHVFNIVKKEFKKNNNNFTINKALFIGIISSFIDSLFDFNWNFLGIYLLTLIFISIVLSSKKNIFREKEKVQFVKIISNFIALIMIIFSLLFAAVDVLIRTGNIRQSFDLFPFFQAHMDAFVEGGDLTKKQFNKWGDIYKNNPSSYSYLYSNDDSKKENVLLKGALYDMDPWARLNHQEIISDYLKFGEFVLAEKEIVSWVKIKDVLFSKNQQIDYEDKKELAISMVKLGDKYYLENRYDDSLNMYLLAYNFDDWIFSKHEISILKEKNSFLEKQKLTDKLRLITLLGKEVDVNNFGLFRNNYANKQMSLLLYLLEDDSFSCCSDTIIEVSNQILEKVPWLESDLVNLIADTLLNKSEKFYNQQNLYLAQENLVMLYDYWDGHIAGGGTYDFDNELDLARALVELGNKFVFSDMSVVIDNYLRAEEVIYWVFVDNKIWLDDYRFNDLSKISQSELEKYAFFVSSKKIIFFGNEDLNSNFLNMMNVENYPKKLLKN